MSFSPKMQITDYLAAFSRRYQRKKMTNLAVSALIAFLGISSFLYGLQLEPIPTIFRWMTVDGTLFTTFGAVFFIVVNIVEMVRKTELTRVSVYYIRLSSAVAESVIISVVLVSQFSFFPEHLPLFDRYDSFVMHVLVPLLGILSFMINDSPIGRLRPLSYWRGTWFVTFYAVIILSLIASERLPAALIPYFFLDFRSVHWSILLFAAVFVYTTGYLMAGRISEWNRRLSWLWFKDIV